MACVLIDSGRVCHEITLWSECGDYGPRGHGPSGGPNIICSLALPSGGDSDGEMNVHAGGTRAKARRQAMI